ncbi:hypothetical protein FN846DRAFT_525308 [Sphaerosporella brunnea]|uniref:Extracellular membrane protein CFEM domain-containing protein n=1 Tax=Sphaerosporella brunnea TaxID=1250544 RepID=A0A5J5F2X3_9PEZI|nr:hypothetical protein FN846DRAFT_525308 [Sphaerosporella brunnea]
MHLYVLLLLSAISAAAQAQTTTFPPSLDFIPPCARPCVNSYIPTLVSSLATTCITFPGFNPALNGTTPGENVRQQIAACVWECDEATNISPAFRAALAQVCAEDTTGDDGKKLSPGAIAGLVVAFVCTLLLSAVGVFVCRRRRQAPSVVVAREAEADAKSISSSSAASFETASQAEKGVANAGFDFGVPPTTPPAVAGQPKPTPYSPVSPVEEQKQEQEEEEGAEGLHCSTTQPEGSRTPTTPPPQLTTPIPLSRADSLSWRRELQDAAERAATRVSLRTTQPLQPNTERRASKGSSILTFATRKGSGRSR